MLQYPRRAVGAAAIGAVAVGLALVLLLGGGSEDAPSSDGGDPGGGDRPATEAGPTSTPGTGDDEKLVDRVLLVGFDGSSLKGEQLEELTSMRPGGYLLTAGNWGGLREGKRLVEALREAGGSGFQPLIATIQEGGEYRSLSDLPPNQREVEIGDRADPAVARRWAEETDTALADAGFDLNLAPVADVATLDSPIADRAFSDDAATTAALTAAAVQGCEESGLACAVSHFPGLGGASQDTDQGPATVGLDAATLAARDLLPFEAAIAENVPAMVVSHGLYTAYDPITPASLSPQIATDLLREELGFEGVAISDDIGAGAISAGSEAGAAAVAAINAGIDLVQIRNPGDVGRVRDALRGALADGSLDVERLREAAGRVAALAEGPEDDRRTGGGGRGN